MSASPPLMNAELANELARLAQRVRRLAPPSRRWPDRFTEEKDEVAAQLEALARRCCAVAARSARPASERANAQRRPRPSRAGVSYITIGSRRVMVQVRRSAFALG